MPKKQQLEYQAEVPAFLQRLQAGHAAQDGRHNAQIPRARGMNGANSRLRMDDLEEDEPVVVDESGREVSVDVEGRRLEEMVVEDNARLKDDSKAVENNAMRPRGEGQAVASGFGKKRKIAKVVGENASVEDVPESELRSGEVYKAVDADDKHSDGQDGVVIKDLKQSTRNLADVIEKGKLDARDDKCASGSTNGPKKGKRKKLKLSFDDNV